MSRSIGRRIGAAVVLWGAAVFVACGDQSPFIERRASPHERYAAALERAGLDATALGRDWLAASRTALTDPVAVQLPFREVGYLPPDAAEAIAYLIDGRRGQRLVANVTVEFPDSAALFVDLFRPRDDSSGAFSRVAFADSGSAKVEIEIEDDGPHLLRIQPELLRGGRYQLDVSVTAALAFPVQGFDSRAIKSRWCADRDGGRRSHQGIDIFAPRGTPVVAAAPGIARPGTNRLGGNVVWLWDDTRRQALYYAHLDSQAVPYGARVRPGDTLGFVGNTGNARTTPPHLHFGIYRRGWGAIDPYAWVYSPDAEPPEITGTPTVVGSRVRTARDGVPLRSLPDPKAPTEAELPRHTLATVRGASGSWYRVSLPDGQTGYVPVNRTEPATAPLRRERLAAARLLKVRPVAAAPAIDSMSAGRAVTVLGRFGDFLLVADAEGRTGWIEDEAG